MDMRMQIRGLAGIIGGIGILTLLLSGMAFGQGAFRIEEKQIAFHDIDIFIQENGKARVEEKFLFNYFAGQAELFETDFEENNPSLFEWKKDYPFIHPYIGLESQVEGIEFILNHTTSQEPALTLSYDYPQNLVQPIKIGTEGRSTRWKLADLWLVQFIAGGNISIPINAQVKIHFPSNAIIDTKLLPPSVVVSGNIITITNFSGNALPIEYTVLTPIADPIDAGKIFEDIASSPAFAFIIAFLAIGGLYVGINREKIARKIEEYVIEHSEFRPQPKQDIDADLDSESG
ncbi:MAG: hypothetical protein V1776_02260 [Candidatus Diapherotrites archaeon]